MHIYVRLLGKEYIEKRIFSNWVNIRLTNVAIRENQETIIIIS